MNVIYLVGRLTKDPEVTYTQGSNAMCIARYTLAVDKRSKGSEKGTDFIRITALGKNGEFAEKWLKKGVKIIVTGHISTGSYEKDGQRIYTTDILADSHEFCESKATAQANATAAAQETTTSTGSIDDFMKIDDDMEELPFS